MHTIGRLEYRLGFKEIWLDDVLYDLRDRLKARLCIEYLVEKQAFDPSTARHLVDEIDVYVRTQGHFPRAADIKIDHYFTDPSGRMQKLRMEIIAVSGLRDGKYYLKIA